MVEVINFDTSNMCKRSIISALKICVPVMLKSKYKYLAIHLIVESFNLKDSTYNLVKYELVEFLSSIDYKTLLNNDQDNITKICNICKSENKCNYDTEFLKKFFKVETIIDNIHLYMMGTEDQKLRLSVARSLTIFVKNIDCGEYYKNNNIYDKCKYTINSFPNAKHLEFCCNNLQFTLPSSIKSNLPVGNFIQPFKTYLNLKKNTKCDCVIKNNLNLIISLITKKLIETIDRNQLYGLLESLDYLIQVYDPTVYMNKMLIYDLITVIVKYLRNPIVIFDLYLHDIVLKLSGSLYSAYTWTYMTKLETNKDDNFNLKKPWYLLYSNNFLINNASNLYTHCVQLLCIYACVVDESSLPSFLTSNLNNSSHTTVSGIVNNTSSNLSTSSTSTKSSLSVTSSNSNQFINIKQKLNISNETFENVNSTKQIKPIDNSQLNQKFNVTYLGLFHNSPVFLKLYDHIRISYNLYKKSTQIDNLDKFSLLIKTTLIVFSQLLECALSVFEIGKYLEEILLYLKILLPIDSSNSIKCVTQLLKSVFGMNLGNLYYVSITDKTKETDQAPDVSLLGGISSNFENTCQVYLDMSHIFEEFKSLVDSDKDPFVMDENIKNKNSLTKETKVSYFSKTLNSFKTVINSHSTNEYNKMRQLKLDTKLVSFYIHSFEIIVIKSLRYYTSTSYVNIQIRVLELLIQLIFLKVNYSLLDSDKAFIEFLLKQFDCLEQTRCSTGSLINYAYDTCSIDESLTDCIPEDLIDPFDIDSNMSRLFLSNPSNQSFQSLTSISHLNQKRNQHQRSFNLIHKMFEFFILLSNEYGSSKEYLEIPKIIQLCDNLSASESSPHTHVIPALRLLVLDMFYKQKPKMEKVNLESIKEIELQRDVILITLLRLIKYPQIWDLLTIVLNKYKHENNEEKWKTTSRQIYDSLFQLLNSNQLKFEEYNGTEIRFVKRYSNLFNPNVESIKLLLNLLNSLSPHVYRPIDFILNGFFELIDKKDMSQGINSFMSTAIIYVYLIINFSNEELILNRLQDGNIKNKLSEITKKRDEIHNSSNYEASSIFLGNYLLKIVEICLEFVDPLIKNNCFDYICSSLNLLSSSSSKSYSEYFCELYVKLNVTCQLLFDYIFYLLYIVRSGAFQKVSCSLSLLLDLVVVGNAENLSVSQSSNFINMCKSFDFLKKLYPILSYLWYYFLFCSNVNGLFKENSNTLSNFVRYINLDSDSYSSLNEKQSKYLIKNVFLKFLINHKKFDIINELDNNNKDNFLDLMLMLNSQAKNLIKLSSLTSFEILKTIEKRWDDFFEKQKLNQIECILKLIQRLHVNTSGILLEFLIHRFLTLKHLRLVRFADHIACERLEMIQLLSRNDLTDQLDEIKINQLINHVLNLKNSSRHQRLISLLKQFKIKIGKLETQNYLNKDISDNEKLSENSFDSINNITKLCKLNEDWYFNEVKVLCYKVDNIKATQHIAKNTPPNSKQCAVLLSPLSNSFLKEVLDANCIQLNILKECLNFGAILANKLQIKTINNSTPQQTVPLWSTSVDTLFKLLEIINYEFSQLKGKLISDNDFISLLNSFKLDSFILPLIEASNIYFSCIFLYPNIQNYANDKDFNQLIQYSIFQFYLINLICVENSSKLTLHLLYQSSLSVYNIISNKCVLKLLLESSEYVFLMSNMIKALYNILSSGIINEAKTNLIIPQLNIDFSKCSGSHFEEDVFKLLLKLKYIVITIIMDNMHDDLCNSKGKSELQRHNKIDTQIFLKSKNRKFSDMIPFYMHSIIIKLYQAICRLPIIDRFLRIPIPLFWDSKFKLEYSDLIRTDITLPSIEYLKDFLILKEYLNHNLLVGWTSRSHFEYEYVNLFTLLNSLFKVENYRHEISKTELPSEEIIEHNKCISLIIKVLSTWLIKSTQFPDSGNPLTSLYEMISRNKLPLFFSRSYGDKYTEINNLVTKFTRIDRYSEKEKLIQLPIDTPFLQQVEFLKNKTYNDDGVFVENIERILINNISNKSNSNFYLSQISLEGHLKFSGILNNAKLSKLSESKPITTSQLNEDFINSTLAEVKIDKMSIEPYQSIKRAFNYNNLDLTSVLRSVLDYYETVFIYAPLQIKYDILKSTICLANSLFDNNQQYELLLQKIKNQLCLLHSSATGEQIMPNQSSIIPIFNELIDDSTLGLLVYMEIFYVCASCNNRSQ